MAATSRAARPESLTEPGEGGKHHIGDFLPAEELNKFLTRYKVEQRSSIKSLVLGNISQF